MFLAIAPSISVNCNYCSQFATIYYGEFISICKRYKNKTKNYNSSNCKLFTQKKEYFIQNLRFIPIVIRIKNSTKLVVLKLLIPCVRNVF